MCMLLIVLPVILLLVISSAPLIALLSLLSNRERDSVCWLALLPGADTKQIKSWPFHY